MLRDNPFLSSTFSKIWLKHFNNGNSAVSHSGIKHLQFVKHSRFPISYNCGGTNTKGVYYEVESDKRNSLKKKIFLVYDVPQYLPHKPIPNDSRLKRLCIKQYPGYVVNLEPFSSFENYMTSVFKGKPRRKFVAYKRKLESELPISYRMFYGEINKDEYDSIFSAFRKMLEKRFEEKKETNNNLDPQEWEFYKEVTYPMVLEKRASLFVMFCDGSPISVMLSFMSESHIILAITGFDIAYRDYNIGTVNIMNLFQWAFKNGFGTLDFSKGHYDYKTRWGSTKYDFEYHILYDRKSLSAKLVANYFAFLFRLKQYLRDKGVNDILYRITYKSS